MSAILGYAFLSIVIGGCVTCAVLGLAICMRSSQISRQEEAEGAPEGALNLHHFSNPDASGSKLGVRVHSHRSVPSIRG
jgi:hypothetical protein